MIPFIKGSMYIANDIITSTGRLYEMPKIKIWYCGKSNSHDIWQDETGKTYTCKNFVDFKPTGQGLAEYAVFDKYVINSTDIIREE